LASGFAKFNQWSDQVNQLLFQDKHSRSRLILAWNDVFAAGTGGSRGRLERGEGDNGGES